ncbi:DUF3592 domain-containing protein [Persicirhabdus sediminis]|uniref:DUF3592 domain-containing protein n=1 Tax=Persicirhabdus sediminis TaxID=454144 RepID=A0A8J7MA49_9BACT|nr:DUF3592 domain-containing protein [Persicirhabdus sediminis]MBK1789707.1 DUF3592 domain-containing protein [Persicirhabdus sediminis]
MSESKQSSLGGRIFLFFLGVALAAMGGFFTYMLWHSFQLAKETRQWPEVECVIVQSRVEERLVPGSPMEYRARVFFDYELDGQSYLGEKISRRGARWTKSKERVEAVLADYPLGSVQPCWVDNANPNIAVLRHDTKAGGYSMWFPGLFFVGGLGIMVASVLPQRNAS